MDQINEYKVFQDHGKAQYDSKSRKVSNAPNEYQKIRVHLIFAVKHDGRHKARLVAGGHLTPDPIESIYSGIVSIRSLMLVIFKELQRITHHYILYSIHSIKDFI